jgi:hypothetical protein
MTGNGAFTPLRVTALVDALGLGACLRGSLRAGHDQQTDGPSVMSQQASTAVLE